METSVTSLGGADLRAARRHAILYVLSASAVFTLGSALVKALTRDFPILEIVMFRSAVGLLVMLPMIMRQGGFSVLKTRRPRGHVMRTVYGFIGTVTSVYGYGVLPLVTVTALGFAMPLFLTILSVPLLGERVGPRRATAVLVGLGGVLLMLRPWHVDADSLSIDAMLIVLAGVVTWSLSMINIRQMGDAGERNVTIVAWYSLGTASLAALGCLTDWVTPSPWQLATLVSAGMMSGFAQWLMTEGYRAAETTLVAPFEYGAIIYATALGIAIWGEWPDIWSLTGVAILIASGLYIWHREVTLGLRR
ncbi:MAG TPA: DMT family transporter [Ktedonobacterales bacterium]|nr:DMT family transporter [Ktedonobacterales bacterium]